jgi:hypothetical protein
LPRSQADREALVRLAVEVGDRMVDNDEHGGNGGVAIHGIFDFGFSILDFGVSLSSSPFPKSKIENPK